MRQVLRYQGSSLETCREPDASQTSDDLIWTKNERCKHRPCAIGSLLRITFDLVPNLSERNHELSREFMHVHLHSAKTTRRKRVMRRFSKVNDLHRPVRGFVGKDVKMPTDWIDTYCSLLINLRWQRIICFHVSLMEGSHCVPWRRTKRISPVKIEGNTLFTLSRSSPSLRDSFRELVIVAAFSLVLFNDCSNSLFSKIFPFALAKS